MQPLAAADALAKPPPILHTAAHTLSVRTKISRNRPRLGERRLELLLNAIIAGLLLGGFYAAVTVGVSISFGILDIVNIAHPAFIILGSYIAYIVNQTLGFDPILTAIVALPAFY